MAGRQGDARHGENVMTYVSGINVPVSFEADSDAQARLIVQHLARLLALEVSYPHDVEVMDAPHADPIEEVIPYQPNRTLPEQALVTDLSAAHGCPACEDEVQQT